MDRLPVAADLGERGGHALAAMSWDSWERVGSKRLLVGLLQLGFWTVAYEVNGYVGTTNTEACLAWSGNRCSPRQCRRQILPVGRWSDSH
jgi:hypothetical protein